MNRGDETEARFLLQHPFFEVEEVLDFSLDSVREKADDLPDKPFKGLEQYIEAERARVASSPLAELLNEFKLDSEFGNTFDQWDLIGGFLLSTDDPNAIGKHLSKYIEQTSKLAVLAFSERDLNTIGSFCRTCVIQFLAVMLKVAKVCDKDLIDSAFNQFNKFVAEIIGTDPYQLRATNRVSPFMNVVTSLLGTLLVTSQQERFIFSATFNDALLLKQKLGASWNVLESSLRYRFALCCLHYALAFYGDLRPLEPRYGFSSNCLLRLRDILVDGMESVPHPTTAIYASVFRYFIDQIDRGVSYRSVEFRLLQENFTDADRTEIMRLADKFRVYHRGVTFERLVLFLGQFQDLQMIRAALVLLRNVKFYTLATLQTMLESVFRELPGIAEPHTVVPLGTPGGSTSLMQYLVSHWSLGELRSENDLERVLETTPDHTPLYFIDDCTLSGTQTINTFAEYLGERKLQPHHTRHCQPLKNPRSLLSRPIVLVYAIGSFFACHRLRMGLAKFGLENVTIKAAGCEDTRLKPFTPSMEYIWEEPGQRESLAAFLSEVGYSILESRSKRKKWKDDRRRESSLGFSDFQRLIVFQYNVPKTTITPLWEGGQFQGKDWMPLFPVSD